MNYNLGRVLPIFRGVYDATATYRNLDVVYFNGSSYVATGETVGNAPTDTEHWVPVALAGTLSPEQVEAIQQEVIAYVQAQGYVIDSNYVHTDNNFTNADKSKLDSIDMSTKQDTLVSGQNIATINHRSLLEGGNIQIDPGSGGTSDYTQLSNLPSINGTTLTGNVSLATPEQLAAKQDTLVSGQNIATINHRSLLEGGNIQIEGGGTPVQYNEIPVDLSQFEQLNAYISNAGAITAGSRAEVVTRLIPVTKGQRFKEYITPIITDHLYASNYCYTGFSAAKPVVGTTLVDFNKFQAKSSLAGADSTPTAGSAEYIAPDDGWVALYFITDQMQVQVYEMTDSIYNVPVYDTWIEEDIECHYQAGVGETHNKANKTYQLKDGVAYKAIYRHTSGTSYNSFVFYDENGNELGNSGDSSTVGEHRMEDLVIPAGAKTITFTYDVANTSKQGNTLTGMAALMKPLMDDGTMPKNDIVYCVSKIKKPVLPYDYQTEGTTFEQQELWSAWAVRFPSGHTLGGKPTPLTSFFHGSSGYVTSEKISYPTYGIALHKELNDRGIAVFDINGYGISFVSDQYSRHWGCPAAVETVKAAYNVLTERFNCRKGMVLSGISMGGAIMKSYAMTYPEDCVACAMEAPSEMGGTFRQSPVAEQVANAWDGDTIDTIKGYTPLALPMIYQSITVDGNTYNVLRAVDRITSNYMFGTTGSGASTTVTNKMYAPFPVETVIWHGDADVNVPLSYSLQFVDCTRNAGSNVKLRFCPNCDHDLNLYPWVKDEVINYIESKLR